MTPFGTIAPADAMRNAVTPPTPGPQNDREREIWNAAWDAGEKSGRRLAALDRPFVPVHAGRKRVDIGALPVLASGCSDNLAIALATYYEGRLDCPGDDEPGGAKDEYDCWKLWAVEQAEAMIARIAEAALSHPDGPKGAAE